MSNDKLSPGHHVGEHVYGYDVLEDGRIRLCDSFKHSINELRDRRLALLDMQEQIARYVSAELSHILAGNREWFDRVEAEFGEGSWRFDGHYLSRRVEDEDAK